MIWSLVLLACGSSGPPVGPSPEATRAAVDALCKIHEGAGIDCERGSGEAVAGGETFGVQVVLDSAEEAFGQYTWEGSVTVTVGGDTLVTRARSYGGSTAEAYERGFHEWAVLAGVAIADSRAEGRPTLKAIEPTIGEGGESLKLGERTVLRGWSLVRGLTEGTIDHAALLKALAPLAGDVGAGAHTLQLVVTNDMGAEEPTWACTVDGTPSETLCTLAKTYPWPKGTVWEAKQVYLVLP